MARRTREEIEQQIVEGLAGPGWVVIDDFLEPDLWRALARGAWHAEGGGGFRAAGIGREGRLAAAVRGDRIRWLESRPAERHERCFLQRVESLRLAINRRLWFGLLDFETHYALYPPGAAYARHLDRPAGRPERTVTLICYLNEDWREGEGGALRLYLADGGHRDLLPLGGRAVVFLSECFEYEVLPANRPRLALTGWYRQRVHGNVMV